MMQQSEDNQIKDGEAAVDAADPAKPIEFRQQWKTLQRSDGYRGKVNMDLPSLGVTTAKFSYPAGKYDVESSEHWGVGIVKRPFDVSYCASGSGTCGQRRIHASEVFVSEPNSGFDAKIRSHADIEYVVISKDRFMKRLPPDLQNIDTVPVYKAAFFSSHLLAHLAQTLLEQLNRPTTVGNFYTDTLVDALVAELLKTVLIETRAHTKQTQSLTDQEFALLEEYIADNLETKIGLEDLSGVVGMPSSQLRGMIKARTGFTPYQFVLDTRVRRAQVMLRTTQRSAAEIAFDCGFSSQSHMSDVFRQRLGKSPGQVRHS